MTAHRIGLDVRAVVHDSRVSHELPAAMRGLRKETV